ncbi:MULTISPECIES: InlB B-repeat-containing protein [unclassified Oceanispirochaeta]|uniref:InlB B-repeat-containing protein n=1 Tax=unclassified Oceanispirochaeta TaxID=2635722 RepID=UPI000E08D79F|nr:MULTISPECIES: InlB B-repeat-containing protein [unclassified Oceanispirochaeta]MBF9019054.1 InlB B-repeat-containing protein [Oceanispirochaeta sp. M2]NPD75551.1 leucine-rich repeat protein [Oceanispirochaeta sp. M1]RDG28591.1 hypothetical protein DV872_26040 [Oceanispirochaeta sp. M1]
MKTTRKVLSMIKNLLLIIIIGLLFSCNQPSDPLENTDEDNDSYTVNFYLDNELYSSVEVQSGEFIFDPGITVPNDRIFTGWYLDSTNHGYKWDFPVDVVNGDLTLYADLLTPSLCFVTFESNGGSDVDVLYVLGGRTITEPVSPTKTGYFFSGWYIDRSLTEPWVFSENILLQDMTLYACWSDRPVYKVLFNTVGGTSVDTQYVFEGLTIKPPVKPYKNEYNFADWYLDAGLTQYWDVTSRTVSDDIELYAKYEPGLWNYELINNGTEVRIIEYNNTGTANVVIPSVLEGLPVTVLGENSFYNKSLTGNLSIPANVKYIEYSAFRLNNFQGQLALPDGLLEIGNFAFGHVSWQSGNTFSGSLDIPNTVTYIGCLLHTEIGRSCKANSPKLQTGIPHFCRS